ncbi:LuxR C-terminal-related transcriptional regulator [Streptomyces sp. CC219B]|uniref:ATP-binding protein n=1 Tax=Streptomyces sp. CC219B TaxID=3044574 RepID=UPI0024A7EDFA|nr:LuxR C-terminal-related transcriptional regulator [Streptomyces sp. CC219B]
MGGSAPRREHQARAEPTRFIDRRAELASGRALLAISRLVTLTGPGGVGKTRLALRLADRVRRTFPDGVRTVHLSGLDDPDLVPLAAADALGLHDHSARPPLTALVEHVRDRRLLLVVDNCEHLLTACAELAAALLRGTHGVRILATSRHRLGLTEEHLLDVRPFPVPDPDDDPNAGTAFPAARPRPGPHSAPPDRTHADTPPPTSTPVPHGRTRTHAAGPRAASTVRATSPPTAPDGHLARAVPPPPTAADRHPAGVVTPAAPGADRHLAGGVTSAAAVADDQPPGAAPLTPTAAHRHPTGNLPPPPTAADGRSAGGALLASAGADGCLAGGVPSTPAVADGGSAGGALLASAGADGHPARGMASTPAGADRHPALALFADRAAAVVPGFRLTAANRAAVARLCRRLDGLPLAIELAAGRLRDLTLDQLLADLDDHYRLLADAAPDTLPRHQTLRAAIDWSHELCTPHERLVWARVSVLAGGFDPETAEAVCGETRGGGDVLEALVGLVDKSVLCREAGPGQTVRYRLLDTLRHYGLDRLRERPGEEAAARRRQRDWMQRRAAACERAWFGPGQREIVARLRADQDNLRAALDFSLGAPGEQRAGLRLAGTLWFYWHACGAPREGCHWLARALAANPEPTPERARALWVAGLLAAGTQDFGQGRRLAEEGRALARDLGEAAEAAHADYVVGVITLFSDDLPAALTHFEAAAARGRVPGQHLSLVGLDRVELACALNFLGEADRAVAVCEEARRLCVRHGEEWVHSYLLRMLALACAVKRDWAQAERHARHALRLKSAVNDVIGIALTLDLLAHVATEQDGDAHERAAVLLGGADRVWADIDRDRWGAATLMTTRRASEHRAREALGGPAYQRAYRRGRALDLDRLVAHALDTDSGEAGEAREAGVPGEAGRAGPAGGPTPPAPLTPRESQVAELVAQGLANQQIADRLVIARRTAEGHVERILNKLGLNNRNQLATWMTTRHRMPLHREGTL